MSFIIRKLGWKKQEKDSRDYKFEKLARVKSYKIVTPPPVGNNRRWCSQVQDQGSLGSCTANAWAGLLDYDENKWPVAGRKYIDMSRLFIYYNERVLDGTVAEDSGANLRDGAAVINASGSCAETLWPYVESKFTIQPTQTCYTAAESNVIHSYYALDGNTAAETLSNLKTTIANGQCFVFGFTVYDSFMTQTMADTGIMPMPNYQAEQQQGGHAVMGIGYNDAEQRFLIRNSWGRNWGLKGINAGYFTMPYAFISDSNQASDFWTLVKDV